MTPSLPDLIAAEREATKAYRKASITYWRARESKDIRVAREAEDAAFDALYDARKAVDAALSAVNA